MPRGYRRVIFAAFGITAAIGGSGVWVYYLDKPVNQQARAQKHYTPAQPVPPPSERIARALEAIEKGQNADQNEERTRRELDAQEGAWRWAKWAAWIAGVQAVLSGIGIAFVVKSLRQGTKGLAAGRLALKHARNANELQKKPRIIITNVAVWQKGDLNFSPPTMRAGELIEISAYVVNEGSGRATIPDSYSHCQVYWRRGPLPMIRPYQPDQVRVPLPGNGKGNGTGKVVLPSGGTENWTLIDEVVKNKSLYVMGFVFYYDDFDHRYTKHFCRVYNPKAQRFEAVTGYLDYEA
ncbi:hypothetical protein ACFOKI_02870 [Sphingomonas qilianensis]|uniref:Uncharacterized protein n=1 Tax=Sphingomonas qilianensis TaxID=1736690 RepID=A0ABU9XVI6_9SPHN